MVYQKDHREGTLVCVKISRSNSNEGGRSCTHMYYLIHTCTSQVDDDDAVYYYIGERLKLEGETGGHKHGGDVGLRLCWKLPFLGRERAAVGVDVDPECRSPRYHETCLALDRA